MYDDLASIERNYGCVAEYNRCMEEREYYTDDNYDDEMEIPYENDEPVDPYVFEVGETYATEDLHGGMTYYRCTKRSKNKVYFRESDWRAWADDISERDERKYDIDRLEDGSEEVLLYHSDTYDFDSKIRAYMPDGFNDLRCTY